MTDYAPLRLYDAGFTDLISVLPPTAELAPTSKIAPTMRGKAPGFRGTDGLWRGYKNWREVRHTEDEIASWQEQGANVGLIAGRFPAVDIDCTDPVYAQIIADFTQAHLGLAPVRIGNPPKQLLTYRTDEPFTRMRLTFARGEKRYLVEILGDGQQYLVHGIHPATQKPYTWSEDLAEIGTDGLTLVTREQCIAFLLKLKEHLESLGCEQVRIAGDGLPRGEAGSQSSLLGPSIEAVEAAVAMIPNTDELYPDREDYLKIGYAIKAAGAMDEDRALSAFCAWAAKHSGGDRVEGNPETPLGDWRKMVGPYAVGWSWLAQEAAKYGFDVASFEFDAIDEGETEASIAATTQLLSDRWLEEKVVAARIGELRFVPQMEKWLVWDGTMWVPDATLRAEEIVKLELSKIAAVICDWGASEQEKTKYRALAIQIEATSKARHIRELMHSNSSIALRPEMLDRDPFLLNTPGGTVDLRTGLMREPNPDDLCTRRTAVAPKPGTPGKWIQFLRQVTQGDAELIDYLQRLSGYCLTGDIREQQLSFFWGPGGNGKGVFVNTIAGIMQDYARAAAMDTFTASSHSKHPTELAMLAGARLVTASETESGKRWAEARIKAMTGGDPITAHFMRQDDFTFMPQFKLVFLGNHKPEIRNIDRAMRRRFHLVPFTFAPKEADPLLPEKLKEEWPQILSWMIEGCLRWQSEGLTPPESIKNATDEYFTDEDAIGRWIEECCELTGHSTAQQLFTVWEEWAHANGEFVGSVRRLHGALHARKFERWTEPETKRPGFKGITVKDRKDFVL